MTHPYIRVAAATLNQTVGDWQGNAVRIKSAILEARGAGAALLVLPEMCVSGYSLGDRLLRKGTLERSWTALQEVATATKGIAVCAGLPIRFDGVIYNAMAVLEGGEVHGLVCKENLATGDVEYENRWFQPWQGGRVDELVSPDGQRIPIGNLIFDLGGRATFALEICEDGWMGMRPGSRYTLAGADIVANPSASWFATGKHAVRRRMVEQISLEDHCAYIYTSLLGCDATRLVFDGSVFVAQDGRMLVEGPRFVFDQDVGVLSTTIDLAELRQRRMENGSWREQVRDLLDGYSGPLPDRVELPMDLAPDPPETPNVPYWLPSSDSLVDVSLQHLVDRNLTPGPIRRTDLIHLEVELALSMALRDYMRKTGVPGYCLALSGGRDSAMVALLVWRMFRYDNPDLSGEDLAALVREHFTCAYMATVNSSVHTRCAARAVAEEFGAEFLDGDIDEGIAQMRGIAEGMLGKTLTWDIPLEDLALQNIQARARSVIIWTVANVRRYVLLATSNLSEAAVGYATMDGDTSGGLAPIADVPKGLIQSWLRWARDRYGLQSIDQVLGVPASAELRPQEDAQTDEDDLMPFVVLDQLMYNFVQKAQEPAEIFRCLWPTFADRYDGPRAFADDIARFVRMLCRAQWKRERFAISFRVMPFDLDPKGGFRFPPVQSGFEEEIADMYTLVDQAYTR